MKFFALATTVSVSLAWKQGRTPTAALLEEISAVEAADTAEEEVADCHKHNCSSGWVPKFTHAELSGSTDADCCQQTCALWTCGDGYEKNTAYDGNLGESNDKCCDSTCKLHQCPDDWVVPPEKQSTKGVTNAACCSRTCALQTCHTPKVKPVDATKLAKVGDSEEDCCDDTCASFICPDGQTIDPNSLTERAMMVEGIAMKVGGGRCCVDTCKAVVGQCALVNGGKAGYTVPPRKFTELAGEDKSHCCVETCENHNCNAANGWHEYTGIKPHCFTQPCTDQQCCQPNCRNWECSDGLKLDSAKGDLVPAADATCCVKTCKLHTCLEDYVPGSNFLKNDTVGETSEVCCEKWCSHHTCPDEGSTLIPDADKVPGSTNFICCEDARCPRFRNMTKTAEAGCNGLSGSKDECENAYTDLENFKSGGWDKVSCEWDTEFNICRVSDDHQPAHCGGRAPEGATTAAAAAPEAGA